MSNGRFLVNDKLQDQQDSEDAMVEDQKAGDYKGVFYDDDTEQRYYEHGAHFQFKDLCLRLENVIRSFSLSRKGIHTDTNLTVINNGGDPQKERIVSRNNVKNGNLIAGSNTLNVGQTNQKNRVNNNPKSSLLANTHLYTNSNKNNGADLKSKDCYNKIIKEDEIMKSDKLSLISSITMKSTERFDINKTVSKVNNQINLFKKIEQTKSKSKINSFNYNNNSNFFINSNNKKHIYVEKTEIDLHNNLKARNTILNNDLNSVDKSINQTQTKNIKPGNGNSFNLKFEILKNNKMVELKNLDKLNCKNSESNRFITTSVDRTNDQSKLKSNISNKIKENNPIDKKTSANLVGEKKIKNQMSFDINIKNGGLSDLLVSQNKSRNYQSSFGKNNIFISDKTPSYNSINMKANNNILKEGFVSKTIKSKSNIEFESIPIKNSGSIASILNRGLTSNLISKTSNQNNNHAVNNFIKNDVISAYKMKNQNGLSSMNKTKNIYTKIELGNKKENQQNYLYKNVNNEKLKGVRIENERIDKNHNTNSIFKMNSSYSIKKNDVIKNRIETSQPHLVLDKARKSSYENSLKLK